jgi:DNA-binding CsgD family transcriptional regulator
MTYTRDMFSLIVDKLGKLDNILTERQICVLTQFIDGMTYNQMAQYHGVSPTRIKQILHGVNKFGKNSIYKKLKCQYDKT